MSEVALFPLRWDLFFQSEPLQYFIGALFITVLIGLLWQRRQFRDFFWGPGDLGASMANLRRFYGLVPLILGIHVGIALIVNGIQGHLLSSENPLTGALAHWIGFLEIMIGLSFIYGVLVRPAACALGILWLIGAYILGVWPILKSIEYLGFAGFFYFAGRGPYAIDRILSPRFEPRGCYAHYALYSLRIGIGLNIMVFGLTEKLANLPLVEAFISENPFLNFTPLSNSSFAMAAGAFEILGGLLMIGGIFPRTVSLIILICVNASLTLYDWKGLIDYLPLYGALAIIFIWEPRNSRQKLIWVEGLRSYSNEDH